MRSPSRRWILVSLLGLGVPCCSRRPESPDRSAGPAPVSHFHDLVAGLGEPGFADGAFTRARFRSPVALAQSEDGRILYVADRDNNRIRRILLSESNRVETAAGTGAAGHRDGPLAAATFNQPSAIVTLSANEVLVYDQGTGLFRRVSFPGRDFPAGNVSTVHVEGTGLPGVWGIARVPSRNAVYFTQPDLGLIGRLDLDSGRVSHVMKNWSDLPSPTAITIHAGGLAVVDRESTFVELLRIPEGQPIETELLCNAKGIVALASSGGKLYGLAAHSKTPWMRLDNGQAVGLWSVWGVPLRVQPDMPGAFLDLPPAQPCGLLADSRSERSFFVSAAGMESVTTLKDYGFDTFRNPIVERPRRGALADDYDYPKKKPEGTTRIILAGDSHLSYPTDAEAEKTTWDRMSTVPKRLELKLATRASLEGSRSRFEVLLAAHGRWAPLLVWTAYELPPLAKTYDADLVILVVPSATGTLQAYLTSPITEEGIPAQTIDPEYLLTSGRAKLVNNPVRKLYELCAAREWALPVGDGPLEISVGIEKLLGSQDTRAEVLELYGRPLGKLRRDLRPQTRLVLCFFPIGDPGRVGAARELVRELAKARRLELLDLTDPVTALARTYYPLSEVVGMDHLTSGGHDLIAEVLSFELERRKFITF